MEAWTSVETTYHQLFWVAHKFVVLWTKICSFGNLVLKTATSKGISNLFLFCILVAKSLYITVVT